LSIFLDQAAFALAWYYGGAAFAPVMWAPVVMVIGNGLRNGTYYAQLSTASGVVCMTIATLYSPFWRSAPLISAGVILSIIVLPAYVRLLSARIAQAKRELKLSAEKFESASKTDALTGILNRSGFFYALEELLEEMQTVGSSGAVMLIDLDGFKAVNDACGHSAGDATLKEVAARLQQCVRVGDTVARYGGDEFVVALAGGMTAEGVERVAQNLIDTISSIRFTEKPELRIGASIGVCMLQEPCFASEGEILDEADRLMYQAKRAGKNRFMSTAECPNRGLLVAGMGGRSIY
jgi:diguanylate cyclase (GGDEF)-like protein